MKNKKGFTLIELLVTIALMLSLLGIAIVSFIGISNRKKEEAYNLVKEQIITAAEQYFDSNEYLFEGLDENSTGIITVGTLVEEDYLNKVTDPRNGNLINNCSQVKVTKKDRRYISEFIEFNKVASDENGKKICKSNYSITISEPGAPDIEYNFYKQGNEASIIKVENEDEWFNIALLGENGKLGVNVTGKSQGNGEIVGISKCISNGNTACTNYGDYVTNENSYKDNESFNYDTKGKKVCYKVTNVSGKSTSTCAFAKVDTKAPNITTYIENENKWINKNSKYGYEVKDEISGIDEITNYWNNSGLNETNVDTFKSGYKNGGSTTINRNGDKSFIKKDYEFSAEGVRKYMAKACDLAGNCSYGTERVVKIDKTSPKCEVTLSGKNNGGNKVGDVQWYIGNNAEVTFDITKGDDLSGINNNYNYSIAKQTMETTATSKSISVHDNAGNIKTCSSPKYGIEKKVTIVFDKDMSNIATSTRNNRDEKYIKDFSGFKVFDTSKGACGYGTCNTILCRTNEGNECTKDYFAKSCMYVYGHLKYFKATGMSVGSSVSINDSTKNNGEMFTEGEIRRSGNACGHDGKAYKYNDCGSSGGSTLVSKIYKYKSPAGNISNGIRLITEYTADCTGTFPKYK